jgi:hypothetical protein
MQREIGIEPGAAAKSAAQREAGAVPRGQFQASMGIRVSRAVGQKFELPGKQAAQKISQPVTPMGDVP